MWLELFFRGVIIGLASTVPLGAIGILCIQRTLSKNMRAGFISGLGAATADLLYATIAFFFLALVGPFIETNKTVLTIVAGVCIMAVGINIFLKNPLVQIRRNRTGKSNIFKDYISTFLLTLTNPAPLFLFVTLFAGFGLTSDIGQLNGVALLVGVLSGCAGWWFILTFSINLVRKKFRPRHILWINRVSGLVITILGLLIILSVVLKINLSLGDVHI